jgi:hypothetical protein
MRRLSVVCALLFCLGCTDGGIGSIGSGALNEADCRQLITKINEVSYSTLSASERAEIEPTTDAFNRSVQECVSDKVWNRSGYDCVMKASSMNDLRICTMKN